MKNIRDFDIENKKVLVRCDFNVPLDDDGKISDDFRIQKSLSTIRHLVSKKAKIILMSHLGDPDGNRVAMLKLDKVSDRLSELLGASVARADDCIGPEVKKQISQLKQGDVLLLENLRFHKEEQENNLEFAKELSELGEIYINDAFSDSHRTHASIVGIPQYLPHGMGLLLEKEVKNLGKILGDPEKPIVVLVGGVKVATKSAFIDKISNIADTILVSGLIQKEILDKKIQFTHPEKIMGPQDNLDEQDISGATIAIFKEKISAAKTVVWNGPFGKFEENEYKKGTLAIAKAIIESGAFSVVGGRETIQFLRQEGMLDKFSHVSTGGGAMLDYLSDGQLPGLDALSN